MMAYIDSWINSASALFSQALAGEPQLVESAASALESGSFAFAATLGGEQEGEFAVFIDRSALDSPLMGEGVDQKSAWGELLREVAESAAGDLLVKTGRKCRVEKFREVPGVTGQPEAASEPAISRSFLLKGPERVWPLLVSDEIHATQPAQKPAAPAFAVPPPPPQPVPPAPADRAGLDLLLDIELEATLRFGCRELPLGQVLDLGPGDVVQLDRTVDDPVDLVVGDKIVAKGQVVLVNGNFALRVTEVATPRRRLESIRCLF
jgi:flagellar motor switch protein FliN/FliY